MNATDSCRTSILFNLDVCCPMIIICKIENSFLTDSGVKGFRCRQLSQYPDQLDRTDSQAGGHFNFETTPITN